MSEYIYHTDMPERETTADEREMERNRSIAYLMKAVPAGRTAVLHQTRWHRYKENDASGYYTDEDIEEERLILVDKLTDLHNDHRQLQELRQA